MPKFIRVKAAPGYSESLIEEQDYYVNVELITFVLQDSRNPDQSSLRLVGSDHVITSPNQRRASYHALAGHKVTATPLAESQPQNYALTVLRWRRNEESCVIKRPF